MLRALFGEESTILREANFQILLLTALLPALGTALVSPLLDSLIEPFGTSAANIGLMVSFFTAPPILTIPLAGVLADKYSRKSVLAGGLVLFGTGGSAIALTSDFRIVLALRSLQGVGFGCLLPIITTSIGDTYSGTREATGQGLRLMMNGLSGTVVPVFAGALVVFTWQYPFLLYATAFPVAIAVALWFEEPASKGENGATDRGQQSSQRDLLALLRHRRVFLLVVGRAFPMIVWTAFLTYNSLIVQQLLGGVPQQAGLLVAVGSLVFAVGASQSGRFTAVVGNRYRLLLIANGTLGGGFVGLLVVPHIALGFLTLATAGVGFALSMALYRSIVTGLASDALRGRLVSLSAAVERISATVTPIAMGGAIWALTPAVGPERALQFAGAGAALVGSGGSVLLIVVARITGPAPSETSDVLEET